MMTAAPVHQETIPMLASAFKDLEVKAAIDRGCSLTKVLFVTKDAKVTDAEYLPMRCLTFLNKDFEDALRVMKEQAELPASGKLHVTGVGCANELEKIKEIIGLDVEFVNEFLTIGRGPFFLVTNAKPEDIFHPPPEIKNKLEISWKEMGIELTQSQQQNEDAGDGPFPALAMYVGSGAAVFEILKDGTFRFNSGTVMSGRPFMGLANALLGTNKYDEIMELAGKGDPAKTDLLVRDLMKEDPNSPYAFFPQDLPLFAFGKASEDGWDINDCSKEDIALSLVSLFATSVCTVVFPCVKMTNLKIVYLCGNFFRSELIRQLIHEKLQIFNDGTPLELKTIKTGHTGAIGAMFSVAEDLQKYIKSI